MKAMKLQESIFHSEKLLNVVGVGNTAAYHIRVSRGKQIGSLGAIASDLQGEASNQGEYHTDKRPIVQRFRSILGR